VGDVINWLAGEPPFFGDGFESSNTGGWGNGSNVECSHDICEVGPPLGRLCDPCVAQICDVDPWCCDVAWDSICVGEVSSVCGITCGLEVALEYASGSCHYTPNEVFDTVSNLLTARGHNVTYVSGTDIDTPGEISMYDVVVLGGPGGGSMDYSVFDGVVDAYVRAGGGLVGSGWLMYSTILDGAPNIEADMPAVRDNGYNGATTVTPIGGHPITNGLGSFTANQYCPYGGGAKPGSTVLLTGGGQDVGEVWSLDSGRVVYLGPMFLECLVNYDNESLLDGSQPDATEILMRSIEWAGGALSEPADRQP
jgi:hypothetical protein